MHAIFLINIKHTSFQKLVCGASIKSNISLLKKKKTIFINRPSHSVYPSQRVIPRGNVAAVEPYVHTPQKSSTTSNITQLKKQQHQQQLQQHQQQQLLQDLTNLKLNQNSTANNNNLNVNHMTFPESDETKLARQKLHMKQHSQDLDNEYVSDFTAKKTDPKYQTLPSSTKFGLNKSASSGMIPIPSYSSSLLKKVMQKTNSNESVSANSSESDSLHCTKTNNQQQNSHQQLTVHSTPLNSINKSVAVPISNSTTSTSSTSAATVTTLISSHNHKDDKPHLKSRGRSLQIPSGNLVVPPRKPISSVAPTTVQSPRVHMVAPTINTALVLSTSESSKTRPALPPKPNKNGESETAPTTTAISLASINTNSSNTKVLKSNNVSSVPTLVSAPINKPPISEPIVPTTTTATQTLSDTNQPSMLLAQNVVDNLPIKAKPLTIKKQPLSEQPPRLRSLTSGIKPIQYTSRRIEMPPEFLFPEKSNLKPDSKVKSMTTTPAINNQTVVDSNAQSPGGSSIDETDKSTSSSMSCDEKLTVQNDILRRTRSALNENVKVKLARRVSFDPLALLLDASLEGELELVQKTAMQVIMFRKL